MYVYIAPSHPVSTLYTFSPWRRSQFEILKTYINICISNIVYITYIYIVYNASLPRILLPLPASWNITLPTYVSYLYQTEVTVYYLTEQQNTRSVLFTDSVPYVKTRLQRHRRVHLCLKKICLLQKLTHTILKNNSTIIFLHHMFLYWFTASNTSC